MNQAIETRARKRLRSRKRVERLFGVVCVLALILSALLLFALVWGVAKDGVGRLNWSFIESFPSRIASRAGIKAALAGTLWIIGLTILIAVPIGLASAVYLEEVAPKNRLVRFIELNVANLAGVPSILYGLLGLAVFVRYMGLGRTVIAGALTLSLLILPMIIITAQEALRAVPRAYREGSLALGTTPWRTTLKITLPCALPGILTGVILSVSRAMGETAPLITIGALTYVAFTPTGPNDGFTALPIQIFNWASRPQASFHENAAAAIIVLLVVLLGMNLVAIILRDRAHRKA